MATIAAMALIAGAVIAWFSRPSIAEIDSRAAEIAASGSPEPSASAASPPTVEGALVCMIDTSRSRVTVSPTTDVPIDWRGDGCINGKSQYVAGPDGWTRVLAPKGEDNVTVAVYDPQKRVYRTDRYLLDAETVAQIRLARGSDEPPQCNGGEEAIRRLSDAQAAVRALLPAQPNERLVYSCTKAP